MKNFSKNNDNLYKCEECSKTYKSINVLSKHIGKCHDKKLYYDKWLKDENEGLCKICNSPTKFVSFGKGGYNDTCCEEHHLKLTIDKLHKGCIKKYNTDNPMKSNYFVEKRKINNISKYNVDHPMKLSLNKNKLIKTNIEKYNCKCPLQNEKVNEKTILTNNIKFGVDHHMKNDTIKNKQSNTNIKLYGVKCVLERQDIKNNVKNNNMLNHGVEHHMQRKEIFDKQQHNSFKYKKFKDTELMYQSSYEYDFLEKYYNNFPDIQRGYSIKYKYYDKNKIYYPDFYIPSLNLIVEIKNGFLLKRDQFKIECKEKSTIKLGYNYILIVDKNYDEFNKYL